MERFFDLRGAELLAAAASAPLLFRDLSALLALGLWCFLEGLGGGCSGAGISDL